MKIDDLFNHVLIEPANRGLTKLSIVSGYATATMVAKHAEGLRAVRKNVEIELIVGMCLSDGLTQRNHLAFKELAETLPGFSCYYLVRPPKNHAKVYIWGNSSGPQEAYNGSANYTQNAYSPYQIEAMSTDDPAECLAFFEQVKANCYECRDPRIEQVISIVEETFWPRRRRPVGAAEALEAVEVEDADELVPADLEGLPHITIDLLDSSGNLPDRSGLNWGQREGREPNQAYIRVPASVYNTDFFPPVATHFTLLTDDNKVLVCTRAQANGKAIHTPMNNSLIGEYFRNRLGVANGALVRTQDLTDYGRHTLDFYKIDDETYYMNFSV